MGGQAEESPRLCTSLLPLLVPLSPRFRVSVPVGRAWTAAQGKEVNTGNGGKNLIKRILSLSDFYCKSSDLPVNLGKVAELSLYKCVFIPPGNWDPERAAPQVEAGRAVGS